MNPFESAPKALPKLYHPCKIVLQIFLKLLLKVQLGPFIGYTQYLSGITLIKLLRIFFPRGHSEK